jgi:hypothetical protein
MSGGKQEYTVKDRRHFAPDGAPKDPGPDAQPIEETKRAEGDDGAAREGSPAGPEPPVAFAAFALSLASQAHLLLKSEGTDAAPAEALGHARYIVATLEMLQDKTQGRLDEGERRLLEQLLFELRMTYVQKVQGGGV